MKAHCFDLSIPGFTIACKAWGNANNPPMLALHGWLDNANSFARLFPVPGMNHCQGGPATEQFDLLTSLVQWVEKGQAPTQVIATARTGINPDVPADWATQGKPRSRPLCAYPQQVRYAGSGDVNDARNFSCQ